MLYLDAQENNKEKYKLLLEYIFSKTNKVSFHLPNFSNSGYQNIKFNNNGEPNTEYIEYVEKNKKLLDLCFKNGAKKQISNWYIDRKLSYNTQIIMVKIFKELKQMLSKNHLFEWQYPNLPEDICFFMVMNVNFILLHTILNSLYCKKTQKTSFF